MPQRLLTAADVRDSADERVLTGHVQYLHMDVAEVAFRSGSVELSGTIWSPANLDGGPGVVLVGGSGPTDRTNGGYFDALRDRLVAAQVVVLGYDKRGSGRSSGSWAPANVDDLAADAVAAVEVLRQHIGVAPGRVGVFGHSEGGWVVLRACAAARPRFVILNSCPAVSFLEAEIHALVGSGVNSGHAHVLFDRLQRAAHDGATAWAANQILALQTYSRSQAVSGGAGFRVDEDTWTQFRSWIDYSPETDLARLSVATLALYGELDPLVPVPASLHVIKRDAPTVHTVVLPGADHRVQVDGRPASDYFETITSWIATTSTAVN